MSDVKYSFAKHIGASLIAGLMFSLALGVIFGFKMVGINESLHHYYFAYPFMLNYVPLYLLFGLFFGLVFGVIGGILMRDSLEKKRLSFITNLGLSYLLFLVVFLILGVPLGVISGMFLATLVFVTARGTRPPLHRLYFAVFFTSVFFNYSWQWVRQHYIVNPFMSTPHTKMTDLVFTLIWALLVLIAFRIFMKPFFKLPVKAFYWIGSTAVIVLFLIGGAYYLIQPGPSETGPVNNTKITPQPTDVKVVVIGIDGFWWRVLNPLIEQGRVPHLQEMVENGASGPLATLYPTFSPKIWTSISTGKSVKKHGVTSFLVWKFPWTGFSVPCHITPKITAELDWMRKHLLTIAPITNQFMDATPIWRMLSDAGHSVGMINWWVSWPADSVNGFVVTDHCLYNKEYYTENFKDKEGNTPYDIYPQSLLPELIGFSRSPDDLTEAEVRRFINITDPAFLKKFFDIHTYDYLDKAYMASMFKYSYPEDATFAAAGKYLLENYQTDLFCLYLDGVDSMEHQYLRYYFADQHPDKLLPENISRYRNLINNYYIYMDDIIGSLQAVAEPNTVFMVISDHGFDEIMLPTGHYNHMNSPPGVFICSGPGIKPGIKIEDAHVYDITPTILYMLGMPYAEDFDGKVLTEIFTDPRPMATIPTYETGHRASHKVMKSDIDNAYKDKLKALGYTQ